MSKLFASSSARWCRPCQMDVVALPRPRFSGVLLVLAVLLTLALIAFSSVIGPFIMFTLPLILVAGFAIGPLMSLVTAPDVCPACARELIFASRFEASHHEHELERSVRASRVIASPAHAAAGDMKAA